MNSRQKKKCNKNCESCKLFKEWDCFNGQYGEYGRCELPLEDDYDLPFGGDFREQIKNITGKSVCKYWKRK